jgi:hypothetical protein
MRNYSSSHGRSQLNNPKNGYQRVTVDRQDIRHLEVFNNGSWRHDAACREYTNKDCRK